MKSIFVIVGLVLVSWSALAQSEHPQQETISAAHQPETNERGSEQAPFIIKIQQASDTQQETTTNRADGTKQRVDGWFAGWSLGDKIAGIASVAGLLQFLALVITIFVMIVNGRRQLRAHVLPQDLGLYDGMMLTPPQPARANTPGVILNFKNYGQTPAYKVTSWADIVIAEPINEDRMIPPYIPTKYPATLGPDATMPKPIWFSRPLTPAEIIDIGNGSRAIYVYGKIVYSDAFKRRRFTDFRFRYTGVFPPPQGVIFLHCEHGNEAN